MKAIAIDGYGDTGVVRVQEVAEPAPGRGEVVVKMRAAAYQAYYEHLPLPASARPRGPNLPERNAAAGGDPSPALLVQ